MDTLFVGFPKIPRLSREIVISEKIDGTNGQIYITEDEEFWVGSRTRWLGPTEQNDNQGFFKWAMSHKDELMTLGHGRHFGEWWGQGIQRNYGLREKRFSLFNVKRWGDALVRPLCCHVVPVLYEGPFSTLTIENVLGLLINSGSHAAPGFSDPEGIIIFHTAGNLMFKKTVKNDEKQKGDTT
ncbi:MAG: hypothetical protein IMZ43_09610 [Thermoplasmata archaeon]|nr:hypothetical protein [Thermoplasmata archaeon]